jgi:hypothetical protein
MSPNDLGLSTSCYIMSFFAMVAATFTLLAKALITESGSDLLIESPFGSMRMKEKIKK